MDKVGECPGYIWSSRHGKPRLSSWWRTTLSFPEAQMRGFHYGGVPRVMISVSQPCWNIFFPSCRVYICKKIVYISIYCLKAAKYCVLAWLCSDNNNVWNSLVLFVHGFGTGTDDITKMCNSAGECLILIGQMMLCHFLTAGLIRYFPAATFILLYINLQEIVLFHGHFTFNETKQTHFEISHSWD